MTNWQKLMQDFDLEEKVKKFVIDCVADLLGAEKHTFAFVGTNHTDVCDNRSRPHIPHVTDWYNTVGHGRLEYFCTGKSGDKPGDPVIIVQEYVVGTPAYAGYVQGYWYIRKPQTGEGES